ncbi:MAG TPA: c-type cytochrome, partial [Burkholderiales bacterium]|nr:c-type cytochrome [Burkholderiales bacterium]
PADFRQRSEPPRLDAMSTAELVATLDHANGWHRETAARLLYERQDRAAVSAVTRLVETAQHPEGRIRALYALDGLAALSADVLLTALGEDHARVRAHAVRLAEKLAADFPEVRASLYSLVEDDDLQVRYQLAFSLGELPAQIQRSRALAAIARKDGADPYVRFAVLSSCAEGAGGLLAELALDAEMRSTEPGREMLEALASQMGKQQRPEDVVAVIAILRQLPRSEEPTLQAIVRGLALKEGSRLQQQVAAATGGLSEDLVAGLVRQARRIATDRDAPPPDRVAAVHQLRLGKYDPLADVFADLLQPRQPAEVQQAALAALATFEDAAVAALLLDHWPGLTPALRSQAGDVLASRESWLLQLIHDLEQGRIAPGDLQPGRLQLLAQHGNARIRAAAEQLASQSRAGSRAEVVDDYEEVIAMSGDLARGKEVFKRVCATCHQAEDTGHAVGPNIATMRNRGPESILVNVLDPNREVNPEYLNYIVVTLDGRTLSGMIADETATGLTLKRAENASDTILRIEIEEMRSTGMSLMPEGLEKDLDKQALADLVAYLTSIE